MFIDEEINLLKAQKQVLATESELNRRALIFEWRQLRGSVRWPKPNMEWLHSIQPALYVAAPLMGFFLVRKWRASKGLWLKLLFYWQMGKKAWKFWSLWQRR